MDLYTTIGHILLLPLQFVFLPALFGRPFLNVISCMVPSLASILLCTVSLKDLLSFSFSLIANSPHPLFFTTFCMDNFVSFLTALSSSSLAGTLIYPQIINAMIYYKAHIWLCNHPLPISNMHFFNRTPLLSEWTQYFLHGSPTGPAFLFSLTSCFHFLAGYVLVKLSYYYRLYSSLLGLCVCHPLFSVGSTSFSGKPSLTAFQPHSDWDRCPLQFFRITLHLFYNSA